MNNPDIVCPVCKLRVERHLDLARHIDKVHTNPYPCHFRLRGHDFLRFICLCGDDFGRMSKFIAHLRSHDDDGLIMAARLWTLRQNLPAMEAGP